MYPNPGFFDYVYNALHKYKHNKDVRSICGYQFPGIDQPNAGACLASRFVPWGWATWKNRWVDYNVDLDYSIKKIFELGLYDNLPEDIKIYIDHYRVKEATYEADIWSVNWVLCHYITQSYSLFPSKSFIRNIGFDGSGVTVLRHKPLII